MTRPVPASKVVPSDDEVAQEITTRVAEEHAGQPQAWVDDAIRAAVDQEMMERRTLQQWAQRNYDEQAGNA